jgi:uncharacterized protein (TIGR03083 family)
VGRAAAATVWRAVHAERRALAEELTGLTEEQWRVPSLCPGWDVHDVVAHLVDTARTGRLRFVRELVAARGDFDRANERGVAREKRSDPLDTLAALRAVATLTRTPPAAVATRLVEAIVHGEDVRRPLGRRGTYPHEAVVQALAHQLRTATSFGGGRERAEGLRLVDVETGTAWGRGADVRGQALDLLVAVSGRPVEPSLLTGPGSGELLSRLG